MFEKILRDVLTYFEERLADDDIVVSPQSNLMDDLCLSSLEMLSSLLALEDNYGITIPEKCLRKILTIEDLARVLADIAEKKI